jgi:hypothetical protein
MSTATQAPAKGRLGQIRTIVLLQLVAMAKTGLWRRGQHPKHHGVVRATFEVLDTIPTKYKVGLFAKPGRYDALIRYSNGPQTQDGEPGPQGMAIKLIGVPGTKILDAEADAVTHDLILIDGPVFFVRDTAWYAGLFKELVRKNGGKPTEWLAALEQAHPQDIAVVENYHNRVADSPLARPFWSQVPFAFGPDDTTICRYSVTPYPENMISPIPAQYRDKDYLRRAMVDQLTTAARPAMFDFFLQLRTDATPEVIDNPTVEWDTPTQRVAVITIPAQDFDRPDQVRFGENLSYTPWHALPEHRPVGQINEIRRTVYAATSRMRHVLNLSPRKEPTSAVAPRTTGGPLKRWAKAVAAAAVISGVVLVADKLWSMLHIPLPDHPAVEKSVWLKQNWPAGAREWYHHANQGGQFPPMINVPYEWFIALEQPYLSLAAVPPLADQAYLDRFGFIPSTTEDGAYDWRNCREPETGGTGYESTTSLLSWRHRLPVGFTCSDRRADPMRHPDGSPWRNPATGSTMSTLGLTCAACHTGRLTYRGTEFLVDGGSAMTDVVKLNEAIGVSLVLTKLDPLRFNRFALRLLGAGANDESRAALRDQLDVVFGRVRKLRALDEKVASQGVKEGFGRLDALNRIGNQVFSIDLNEPANYAGSSAPVHYPRIWDTPWFPWAQYNGSIGQPMVRNAGEALGTGASIVLAGAPSADSQLTAPLFTSTVQFRTVFQMEQMLSGKEQPTAEKKFTGLHAPKWPEETLGKIKTELAERGAKVYAEVCEHCHRPAKTNDAFWDDENWTKPNQFGKRYLKVNLIPVEEVGTDRAHVDNLATRRVRVPPDLGLTSDNFGLALGQLVGKAVDLWYERQSIPQDKRHEMDGFRKNEVEARMAYKARPLDGAWATPPYLHNGSVPTIAALLGPPADRPKKFWLGHREYDPERLGYRFDKLPGGFEFDTTLPGNHNTGHEFDDPYDKDKMRPGRVGRKLSADERLALIEFLKSMGGLEPQPR